jgi:mRNA-degrading endonuclease toxin of MazEF toxin-antitoxin module
MTLRGDVVIVQFAYVTGGKGKTRPAVVVQCDRLNKQINNTIVAMITGNLRLIGKEPTQLLIDPSTPEGASSGLAHASALKCEYLFTLTQDDILKTVGHLSDILKGRLADCLKAALELP